VKVVRWGRRGRVEIWVAKKEKKQTIHTFYETHSRERRK